MTPIHISENLFISPNIKKWFWLWMIDREVFKIKKGFQGENLPISWLGASCFRLDILSAEFQLILCG